MDTIRLVTIDEGGEPIYDPNGNIVGKTDPLQELVSSSGQRILISVGIKHAMQEYYLSINDIKKIWSGYLSMDYKRRGWVNFNHLLSYLQEQKYSVVEPFLFKFWELIDRTDREKCRFDEFLPACCAFCLFTRADMISFIFNLLDRDNDQALCKVDLLKFSALSRAGRKEKQKIIRLYPTNTNLAIDLFRFARGDKIDIEEFTECVK